MNNVMAPLLTINNQPCRHNEPKRMRDKIAASVDGKLNFPSDHDHVTTPRTLISVQTCREHVKHRYVEIPQENKKTKEIWYIHLTFSECNVV